MKKTIVFIALAIIPQVTMAIENGTSLGWSDYSDMATFNCTGTVIGGKFMLTAGHCELQNNNIAFSNGKYTTATVSNNPDGYGNPDGPDISVWTLATPHETSHIRFLANLNSDPVSNGELINIYGFAGSHQLKTAQTRIDFSSTTKPDWYASVDIGHGITQEGDSGGAWTNQAGEIVGIHRSGADGTMLATRLSTSKDWLLGEINGWHYPTVATANGTKTITVQSLHNSNVADGAYPEGNITIVGGSCSGKNPITPFEKCTYEIDATGEGKLWLSDSEFIHINKPIAPPSTGGSSGGSSGGSMSLFSMLAMLGLGFYRRQQRK